MHHASCLKFTQIFLGLNTMVFTCVSVPSFYAHGTLDSFALAPLALESKPAEDP
jgi:hypothetical protein